VFDVLNIEERERMDSTIKEGIGLTGELFMVQSVVEIRSMSWVGFSCVNAGIAMVDTDVGNVIHGEDGVRIGKYLVAEDPDLADRSGLIGIVPFRGVIKIDYSILPT
jgi:hypothetical protein